MTNEEKAAQIAALIEERDACVRSGKDDRVADCEANLAALGAAGSAPAKRSEKRKSEVPAIKALEPKPDPEPEAA